MVRAAYEGSYARLGGLCKLRERKLVFCGAFNPLTHRHGIKCVEEQSREAEEVIREMVRLRNSAYFDWRPLGGVRTWGSGVVFRDGITFLMLITIRSLQNFPY
jgi:hypothetical protein